MEARRRWIVAAVLSVLIGQFLVLGLIQAWEDSYTIDEPVYAASGSTAWRQRDLRINYEHPPLAKLLAALPAELFDDVEVPLDTSAWAQGSQLRLAYEMVQSNRGEIQRVTFLYRVVPLLVAASLGALLYFLGRDLFGWRAGLLSAILWLTLPLAVGYGHLNGLDVPGSAALLGSLWLLLRYIDRPTLYRLFAVGIGVGLALLTRGAIGLVVAAAVFVSVLINDLPRQEVLSPLRAAVPLICGWVMVWLAYLLLDPSGLDVAIFDSKNQTLLTSPGSSVPAHIALAVPWPDGFQAGIRFMSYVHTTGESPGYLFGVPFVGAPLWFWFGSFLLKMTTISLVVIVAGLVSWRWLARSVVRRALVVLGPMMVGLVTMMAFAQRPFGVRYLIPMIVIALVASGTLATVVPRRTALATLVIVLIAQSGVLWASHPYSLAWSNPLFGQSWRLAADSNVDWGQDFYRLQAWAEGKDTVYVSYYGFGPSLELTEIQNAVPGLNVTGLLLGLDAGFNAPPAEGEYVAISASALNLVRDQFGLLHSVCPVEKIGATILVYRFEQMPDTLTAPHSLTRDQVGLPAALCEDEVYSTYVGRATLGPVSSGD